VRRALSPNRNVTIQSRRGYVRWWISFLRLVRVRMRMAELYRKRLHMITHIEISGGYFKI
jgi:hypothetical protein